MRKQILSLIAVVVLSAVSTTLYAQAFQQGKSSIQLGYGFGNFSQAYFQTYETNYPDEFSYKGTGPFFVKYEYAVTDKIGLGLNIAYIGAEVSYVDKGHVTTSGAFYKQTITWTSTSFLARMNLHFGDNEKFDPFWGFGMGYRTGTYKYDDNDPNYDNSEKAKSIIPFGFETTVGARFYFTDNIGIYAETGLAKAVFQGGITLNF
jgi:opacity protein-like surface antigen